MKSKGKGESHGRKGQGGGGMKQGDQIARQGKGRQNPTMAKASAAGSKRPPATPPGDPDKLAELQGALVERAQLLWQCTYLLWRIAYSHIFPRHLALLQKGQWLHMPNQNDVGQPADRVQISPRLAGQYDKHGVVDAGEEGGSTAAERVQADQEADQEFQHMHGACNNGRTIQSIYSWWTRFQVNDWEALNIVSTFGHGVANPVKSVKINVLAEKHLGRFGGEMEPWETVVMNLAARAAQASAAHPPPTTDTDSNVSMLRTWKQIRPFDGQAAVALLKKKIDNEYALLGSHCRPIFHAFRRPTYSSGESTSYVPKCYAGMHCEAVLASLIKCHPDDVNTKAGILLKEHTKVMSCLRDRDLRLSNKLFRI
jgi:hypothetical protein